MASYIIKKSYSPIRIVNFDTFNYPAVSVVRSKSAVYGYDNNTARASAEENNYRKYVEVDLSVEIQKQLDSAADAKEERRIILQYILKHLKGKKYRTSDNRLVEINRLGAKKITHSASLIKLRVAPHLAELIEIGEFQELAGAKPNKQHNFKHFAYYNVIFKVAETWYRGTLNIGVLENGESRLYELNPFREVEETEPPNLHQASRVQAESPT